MAGCRARRLAAGGWSNVAHTVASACALQAHALHDVGGGPKVWDSHSGSATAYKVAVLLLDVHVFGHLEELVEGRARHDELDILCKPNPTACRSRLKRGRRLQAAARMLMAPKPWPTITLWCIQPRAAMRLRSGETTPALTYSPSQVAV